MFPRGWRDWPDDLAVGAIGKLDRESGGRVLPNNAQHGNVGSTMGFLGEHGSAGG